MFNCGKLTSDPPTLGSAVNSGRRLRFRLRMTVTAPKISMYRKAPNATVPLSSLTLLKPCLKVNPERKPPPDHLCLGNTSAVGTNQRPVSPTVVIVDGRVVASGSGAAAGAFCALATVLTSRQIAAYKPVARSEILITEPSNEAQVYHGS